MKLNVPEGIIKEASNELGNKTPTRLHSSFHQFWSYFKQRFDSIFFRYPSGPAKMKINILNLSKIHKK